MKYILEYSNFLDTIDLTYMTDGKNSRSEPLTEEGFIKLFEENCKNFNFKNTQLYRGVILKYDTDFFYINPITERGESDYMKRAIKTRDYNTKLKEPQFKDLPDRNKCVIGSTHPKAAMITVGNLYDEIQEDRTFIIIPFDNVKIAVAPILDLQGFKRIKPIDDMKRRDFKLRKYTKRFILPIEDNHPAHAKEIWTEGQCLLVRYSSLERLKELVKQRS